MQGLAHRQKLFGPWMWEPEPEEEWDDEEDVDNQDAEYESGDEAVPEADKWDGWDDVDGEEGTKEARNSVHNPEPRNCDGFWNTDRVRRVMRRETAGVVSVPIGISDWR